jgi:hypothetical protein
MFRTPQPSSAAKVFTHIPLRSFFHTRSARFVVQL